MRAHLFIRSRQSHLAVALSAFCSNPAFAAEITCQGGKIPTPHPDAIAKITIAVLAGLALLTQNGAKADSAEGLAIKPTPDLASAPWVTEKTQGSWEITGGLDMGISGGAWNLNLASENRRSRARTPDTCPPSSRLSFESVLMPQIMMGFLGFEPRADGFKVHPHLPKIWPQIGITRIHFHQLVLDITASETTITVKTVEGQSKPPFFIYLPTGKWRLGYTAPDGSLSKEEVFVMEKPGEGIPIDLKEGRILNLMLG